VRTTTSTSQLVKTGVFKPCYGGAQTYSGTLPDSYWTTAKAIQTLAHEAIHMRQDTVGATVPPDSLVEAQAECSGIQHTAFVAEQLGDTPDDAQSIASFYFDVYYPTMAGLNDAYALAHPYFSSECRPGGALDERPAGSTLWP
jgi:hypothetical protein